MKNVMMHQTCSLYGGDKHIQILSRITSWKIIIWNLEQCFATSGLQTSDGPWLYLYQFTKSVRCILIVAVKIPLLQLLTFCFLLGTK